MICLILKRAKFSRPSGQRGDEDYGVLADGKAVGRKSREPTHLLRLLPDFIFAPSQKSGYLSDWHSISKRQTQKQEV
jgi:hypothetical protein